MDGILVVQRGATLEPPRTLDQALNRLTTAPDRFDDDEPQSPRAADVAATFDEPDDVDARADREQEAMLADLRAQRRPSWWRQLVSHFTR